MRSSLGLRSPGRENRGEVVPQRGRGRDGALAIDGDAEQRDRPALELREVLARQAEEPRDDLRRIREGELTDEVGAAASGEAVDQVVGDPIDELVLAARERPLRERRGDQRAVATVRGLVHPEHDVLAERIAEERDDDGGREGLVVPQQLRDLVVAVHHEDGLRGVVRHARQVEALHGALAPSQRQLGVGVPHVARDGVVEGSEVFEIVEQLHSGLLPALG